MKRRVRYWRVCRCSTVGRVLREAGLLKRNDRRRSGGLSTATPSDIPAAANDLWTVGFKGVVADQGRRGVRAADVRDAVSRYVLRIQLMIRPRGEDVRPVFEELFERYGFAKGWLKAEGNRVRQRIALRHTTR